MMTPAWLRGPMWVQLLLEPYLLSEAVPSAAPLLGGSWVVISGVIRPLIWVITIVTILITLLITTHEPPSKPQTPTLFLSFPKHFLSIPSLKVRNPAYQPCF